MSTPFPPLKATKLWHSTSYPAIDPSRPELNAKGKPVVVGGGGTDVGAAIIKAFAAAGAPQIAIFGHRRDVLESTKAEIEKAYPATHLSTFTADVNKSTEIHLFLSSSGFVSTPNSLASSDIEDWGMSMDVNVKGALFTARAFLRHAAKDAHLLNINSGVAHMPAVPMDISAYAVTKAAAAKLYDYIGAENPELQVVTIQPGVVETYTNIKSGVSAQDDAALPGNSCLWLTSPEAAFLEGRYVWVNWDFDELKQMKEEIFDTDVLNIGLGGVSFIGFTGFG